MYAQSPAADHAFPPRLASLPKQRKSMVSHRASYYLIVMYTLSAVTGNAFPPLLTSLSMAKERYYQSPRVLAYRCQQKLGGFMLLHSPALPPETDSCIFL